MKLEIYCLKDTLTEFMHPYYQPNKHVAMRNFKIALNEPESEVAKIAENIELYQLGWFDTVTGKITSEIKFICRGLDVKNGEFIPEEVKEKKKGFFKNRV